MYGVTLDTANAFGAIVKIVPDAKQLDFFGTHPQQNITLPPHIRSDLANLLSELILGLREDQSPARAVREESSNEQDHS
jgi:hypothetical protein